MSTLKTVLKVLFICILILSFSFCTRNSENVISLAGDWEFRIDSTDIGETEEWFANLLKKP